MREFGLSFPRVIANSALVRNPSDDILKKLSNFCNQIKIRYKPADFAGKYR
jgi:hypothetical protein